MSCVRLRISLYVMPLLSANSIVYLNNLVFDLLRLLLHCTRVFNSIFVRVPSEKPSHYQTFLILFVLFLFSILFQNLISNVPIRHSFFCVKIHDTQLVFYSFSALVFFPRNVLLKCLLPFLFLNLFSYPFATFNFLISVKMDMVGSTQHRFNNYKNISKKHLRLEKPKWEQ